MRFASKVDWWLGPALLAGPLSGLAVVVAGWIDGDVAAVVIGLGTLGGVLLLYAAIVWPLEYELADDGLVIRFGWMRTRIPYAEMTRVTRSRSVLASPALSLDRLQISRLGYGFALISPRERAEFLRVLAARAPHVQIEV